MININLVKSINLGRCILIVGAGASCSAGYPCWRKLAELVNVEYAKQFVVPKAEFDSLNKLIDDNQLLKYFNTIGKNIGKNQLVEIVRNIFANIEKKPSKIYEYVTSWPFQFYLTTNYDSLLHEYLIKNKITALEKGNNRDDFRSMHNGTKDAVFKIHGDFNNPKNLIITGDDYERVRLSNEFDYWREKLFSILNISDIAIIGYSAKDPDFIDQIERAKLIADPSKPIYLFSPDIDTKSIEELAGYNIHTITYENSDGSHSGLKRLLKLYDNFIQKRGDSLVGVAEYNHDEVELATSLYFYNQIVLHDLTIIDRALVNSLLNILLDKKEGLSLIEIKNEIANRKILCDDLSIISSLKNIESKALITQDPINKKFIITDLGKDIVLNGKAINQDIKKKFIIYCMNFFNDYSLDMSSINRIVEQIDRGLISAFRKRGIEISKMLFDNSSTVSINSSTDILGELNGFASNDLLNQEEYLGFVELILNILQAPSQEVKDYLGILANGYFTYQILGHDREARTIRFSELKKKTCCN